MEIRAYAYQFGYDESMVTQPTEQPEDERPRVRSPEERAELVEKMTEAYQRGMTLKQIERRFDINAGYARRLLIRAGVQMRPSASDTPERQRRTGWGGLTRAQGREYDERLEAKAREMKLRRK